MNRILKICAISLLLSTAESATNANARDATPGQLKNLTLEDLMEFDVTSVARRREPYRNLPDGGELGARGYSEFGIPTANWHEIERRIFGKVTWQF